MRALRSLGAAVASLFIDDGSLALWVALILVVTAFVASTPWLEDRCVGGGFVAAIVAALLANVRRSSR